MTGNRMCEGAGRLGKDAIAGDARMPPLAFRLSGIWVDVEMWEIAASRYRVAGGVPGTARRQRFCKAATHPRMGRHIGARDTFHDRDAIRGRPIGAGAVSGLPP
jgi:hypothetical protein